MTSLKATGHTPADHFRGTTKMVDLGKCCGGPRLIAYKIKSLYLVMIEEVD